MTDKIFLFLTAILPTLALLLFFMYSDKFKEPKKTVLSTFILGIFIILVLGYYLRLSKTLALGMLIISLLFAGIIDFISLNSSSTLLYLYLGIFILAWIGQFIGHKFEGKKPAFLKDLQFLLIGPLWLLSYVYNKLNIKI